MIMVTGVDDAKAPVLICLELDALDDTAFATAAQQTSVFARVAPQYKLRIVTALRAAGNVVAMTGDGVNDAPAHKAAAFTVPVLTQLFNCRNARSATALAFRAPFSNRWWWGAIALSSVLPVAVVHWPFRNLAFGTLPMPTGQWGLCVVMAGEVFCGSVSYGSWGDGCGLDGRAPRCWSYRSARRAIRRCAS